MATGGQPSLQDWSGRDSYLSSNSDKWMKVHIGINCGGSSYLLHFNFFYLFFVSFKLAALSLESPDIFKINSSWKVNRTLDKLVLTIFPCQAINVEVALFGGSLGNHHVASVQLDTDSDHEFADGKGQLGEEGHGTAPTLDHMLALGPDLLLYR